MFRKEKDLNNYQQNSSTLAKNQLYQQESMQQDQLLEKWFQKQNDLLKFNIKIKNNQIFQKIQWTLQDSSKLIAFHRQNGNQWTLLSREFPGSSENFIKNHFYSKLRKSIRKLNNWISLNFSKKYTKFNLNIIFKLSNISEGKITGQCQIQDQICQYYKKFIYILIQFYDQDLSAKNQDQNTLVEGLILSLIALDNLFRIISGERYYKGKKKNIAYLKKFNFPLNTKLSLYMIINRQNCYISTSIVQPRSSTEQLSSKCELNPLICPLTFQDNFFSIMCSQRSMDIEKDLQTVAVALTQAGEPTLSSIDDFSFSDNQLREFDIQMGSKPETLFDQYGGKRFDYFDS